ncbi:MAG: outer membrane lipoprotein carrier protein LolA [Bacteroidetes bacterium]|nr:MAG: outer membrane lipoprotein carrier protein LolA [Bacteroidota bacterium]
MKKTILLFFAIFCCFSQIFAQDAAAKAILDAMSDKYKKMKGYKADFTYQLSSDAEKVTDNVKGTISVKGDKFRLKVGKQEIFNNGKTVWTYLKDENEVTITNPKAEDKEMSSPTEIYSMYKKGFKFLFIEESKVGNTLCEIIDLTPENKNLNYFKVRLSIDKATKMIKNWRIFEKTGRKYTYQIENFQANTDLEDSFFSFDKSKYPKVEEVDLR